MAITRSFGILVCLLLQSLANGFQHKLVSDSRVRLSSIEMGPINSIKNLIKGSATKSKYDYIIVGGGTAGCVLANRLSAIENKKVLVVEAGSSDYKNKLIRIPGGILKLFKSKFDWNFETKPDPKVSNRSIYLARGKVLGGSSSLNVLLYNRGDANDYDKWAKAAGSPEWSAANVLPYFKKSEDFHHGATEYHGSGGEFSVTDVRYQNPLSRNFLIACGEKGYTPNDDFNNWSRSQEGYGRYQVTEKDGARCSTATGFLEPVKKRKNLNVLTSALVNKVLFKGNRATGIDVNIGDHKEVIELNQGGEVILTGGAVNTPQILMLSGVGPKRHLVDLGIDVVQDLQGVGANLQDHPAAVVSYQCSEGNEGISVTSKIRIPGTTIPNPKYILQWFLRGSGPLTSVGCDHGAYFKTDSNFKSPDLQMRFLPAKAISPDGMSTFTKFKETANAADGFSFQSIVSRPYSRGQIRLRSNDPKDKPLIDTNYLGDERDIATLRKGIKLARELAKAPAFASYKGFEVFPGPSVQTDSDINDYIRKSLHTSNALVGTCKLGTGPDAVVNSDLRIHGLKGIRIADSSIMPNIPGGQTSAATVMIAEKAAHIITSRA